MRVFAFIALTMCAFAANSILNRAALATTDIGAIEFAGLRVFFGALTLALILGARGSLWIGSFSWPAALGLSAYMLFFSLAYGSLDAGIGALVLFGVVQLAMFAGAVLLGERPKQAAYLGSILGVVGLAVAVWPQGPATFSGVGVAYMVVAGTGWGVFSLAGRGASEPLGTTFLAFLVTLPVMIVVMIGTGSTALSFDVGTAYAALSGAVTSGLGYALWYAVLPQISAVRASIAQLSVPIIAMLGGMVFLDETLTLQFVLGATLVLSGVIWPYLSQRIGHAR
ncbi:MAG: DMT family transporter [Pseudomonadota bacterium]